MAEGLARQISSGLPDGYQGCFGKLPAGHEVAWVLGGLDRRLQRILRAVWQTGVRNS